MAAVTPNINAEKIVGKLTGTTTVSATTYQTNFANTDIPYSNNGTLVGDSTLTWATASSTLQLGTSQTIVFRNSAGAAFLATSSTSGTAIYPCAINQIAFYDQSNGNPASFAFYANTVSGVSLSIGTPGTGNAGAASRLDITGSTAFQSSMRLRNGATPTLVNNGDFWNDNTYINVGIVGLSVTGGSIFSSTTASTFTVKQSNVGNANSAQTVDIRSSDQFTYTLTGNSTFTFSNPGNGKSWMLGLTQNATTSGFTASFTAGTTTIKYPYAIIPVMTPTTGATDIYSFTQLNGIIYCDYSQSYQ